MQETEISTKTKMTITFPVELIMEILSYLPAKSLLNTSKCVCKSWCSAVEEPDFIKKHLNRGAINGGGRGTSSNNNYQSLIFNYAGNNLFRLHLPFNFEDVPPPNPNNSNDDDDDTVLTITPTKLEVDSSLFRYWGSELVCSCNGLLCIDNGQESVILLNPCTREHKISPKQPFQYRNRGSPICYGFGCFYDSTTTTTTTVADQYKVVRIEHTFRSKSETTSSKSEVKVYSLATNSWRTIKDIPDDILEMVTKTTNSKPGVFLNEALHWMSHVTSDLVSFDMRSEEFRIMPRPPYDGNLDSKVLMIMRGCLGMIRMRGHMDCCLEISIMKEYGVSTWTREFRIILNPSYVGSYGIHSIPWLDDQILYEGIGHNRLVVYDMNKKMTGYIDIQNPEYGTESTEPHLSSVDDLLTWGAAYCLRKQYQVLRSCALQTWTDGSHPQHLGSLIEFDVELEVELEICSEESLEAVTDLCMLMLNWYYGSICHEEESLVGVTDVLFN